ncbi:DMT family transporter [Pseudogemmobacter faecipullorum]|uniref:DMT family transporter n=1 Tax=Pseudogemmobacter faecipullorum TaxID=2755041 RepID=A0ABS8CGT4_9RHOB|nr:DMT family transporter [Pseudogemmobacter faecipullorum]MCB5408601.1 DMT family transporter [Pseudogemmobacter faecipullorum]
MSTPQNTRFGIFLMIAACAIFSVQDAISRHLGAAVNSYMVTMIRYWVFAAFVIALAARAPGGLKAATRSRHPWLQILRGLLLVGEIWVMIYAYVKLGLIETHAVFIVYPLLVTILSGPVLGEKVGWRRWLAVLTGFIGVMVILQPGSGVFSLWAMFPFLAAAMFALYSLLTRYVSRDDSAEVSFFWTGTVGALAITPFGLANWQSMVPMDMALMAALCGTSILSHWMLIRAYDLAEASEIQPFAYFQLPMVAILGLVLFGEALRINVLIGAVIVVGAGLFTLWRQRIRAQQAKLS